LKTHRFAGLCLRLSAYLHQLLNTVLLSTVHRNILLGFFFISLFFISHLSSTWFSLIRSLCLAPWLECAVSLVLFPLRLRLLRGALGLFRCALCCLRRTPLPPFGLQGGVADRLHTTCGVSSVSLLALWLGGSEQSCNSTALYSTTSRRYELECGPKADWESPCTEHVQEPIMDSHRIGRG